MEYDKHKLKLDSYYNIELMSLEGVIEMEQCNKANRGCNQNLGNKYACQTSERVRSEKEMVFTKGARNCEHLANDELANMPVGMCYVPWQQWGEVFTGEAGLAHGTIFPELVKPFWVKCGLRM